MARPGPAWVLEPSGMRLIDSTPQARATSTAPEAMSPAARLVACWDEPHWESTVVAGTVRGRPAVSQAVRAMLKDCSPTAVTHPPTTCSTWAGSMPALSITARWTVPSRSAGCMVDRPPPRRPMGLRAASTITTSVMKRSLSTADAAAAPAFHRSQGQQQEAGAQRRQQDGADVEAGDPLQARGSGQGAADERPHHAHRDLGQATV